MLRSVAEVVHHATKIVINNGADLMANPGHQLFSIWQSVSEHVVLKNITIGKKRAAVKSGDRGGHKSSRKRDIRRPGNNLEQCIANRGAY